MSDTLLRREYCKYCHREVYRLIQRDDKILIFQGKMPVMALSNSSNITMTLQCSSGHTTPLIVGDKTGMKTPESLHKQEQAQQRIKTMTQNAENVKQAIIKASST